MSEAEKAALKREVVQCLAGEPGVVRVVVFGSFLTSSAPTDMDVAVFQEGTEPYLELALRYRRRLRSVARRIAVDVVPVRPSPLPTAFMKEIEKGEVVYER